MKSKQQYSWKLSYQYSQSLFFPLSAPFNDKHDQTFLGLGSFIDGIFVYPFTAVTSSLEESNEEIILQVSGSEGPELEF